MANDLVSKFILKQSLQLTGKTNPRSPFASNKPVVTCFGSQSKVKKLMTTTKVSSAPLLIHKSNVAIIEIATLIEGKTNS